MPQYVLDEMEAIRKKYGGLPVHEERGYGNGYIAIPEHHPFAQRYKHCNQDEAPDMFDNNCWTYASFQKIDIKPYTEGYYYVLGFDTAHYNQNIHNWPAVKVVAAIEGYVPIVQSALSGYDKFIIWFDNILEKYLGI